MKSTILATIMLITAAGTAHAESVAKAQKALEKAEANLSQAQKSYNHAAYNLGSGVTGSSFENDLNDASAARAQAQADLRSAQMQEANATAIAGYNVTPTRPSGSINVAVSTLTPATKVNTTVNGVTKTTTAGELAKINPLTQVTVPHVDALIVSQRQGSDHNRRTSHEHAAGTGNGANNAANSNSAHGAGGGNHIGGGSAESGSRSVGHW